MSTASGGKMHANQKVMSQFTMLEQNNDCLKELNPHVAGAIGNFGMINDRVIFADRSEIFRCSSAMR